MRNKAFIRRRFRKREPNLLSTINYQPREGVAAGPMWILKSSTVDDDIPSIEDGSSEEMPSPSKSSPPTLMPLLVTCDSSSHQALPLALSLADDRALERTKARRAISILTKSALGVGILMLPHCFAQLGLVLGTVILTGAGTLTATALQLLLAASQRTGCEDYLDLAGRLERRREWIRWGTGISVLLMMLAPIVVSIQLTTRYTINLLMGRLSSLSWGPMSTLIVAATLSGCLFWPIALITDAKRLAALNILGLLGVFYVVGLAVSELLLHGLTDRDNWRLLGLRGGWQEVGGSLTTILFGFSCHFNLSSAMRELDHPRSPQARWVLKSSCVLTGITYATAGIAGYLRFGEGVSEDLLQMRPGLAYTLGQFVMILVTVASFPLLMIPMRAQLDGFLERIRHGSSQGATPIVEDPSSSVAKDLDEDDTCYGQSALIIVSALVITAALGSPGRVFSLLGALCGGPVLLILPARFYRASTRLYAVDDETPVATWKPTFVESIGWAVTAFGLAKLLASASPLL